MSNQSAKAIRESTDELLTAKQVMKLKIKGLGKVRDQLTACAAVSHQYSSALCHKPNLWQGSAEKIEEFREKGFIQKLEDLRSGTA